ncbi:MAG: surface lipoprotein assembly modifier [Acinetobacter sp.]|nr:surface lipoprotein assembly modifier [Acinetobacter sp.]
MQKKLTTLLCLATSSLTFADTTAPVPPLPILPLTAENQAEQNLNKIIQQTTHNTIQNTNTIEENTKQNNALHLSSQELVQKPELLEHALFSSIMLNNVDAVELLLPLYRQNTPNKSLLIHLSEAMIARKHGKLGTAIKNYQAALVENENMPIFKFALAQSLFENKQFLSAQTHFLSLLQEPDLPAPLKHEIQSYLSHIKQQQDWSIWGGANYTQDKNVNNVPDQTDMGNGWKRNEQKEAAHGIAYSAQISKDWIFADHWTLQPQLAGYGKSYWDNHKYDDLSARVALGAEYQNARHTLTLTPFFQNRWYGTKQYSQEVGLETQWSYWLKPQHRVSLSAEYSHTAHEKQTFLDGHAYAVSNQWLYFQTPRQYWNVGSNYTVRDTEHKEHSFKQYGVQLGFTRQWSKGGFSTSHTLSTNWRNYQGIDIFNIMRKDKDYSASFSLWHNKIQYKGVSPRLVATWYRSDSNHTFYDFSKKNIFVQWSKSF